MLDSLRDSKASWAIQVLIGAIVLSFIFFVGMGGTGQQVQVVATVNGERIPDTAYVQAYRQRFEQYRQFSGQEPGEEMDAMIRQQVLDQLISRELILQEAERVGIVVSDYEVAREIHQISWLKDENGKFNKERYEEFRLKRPGFEQELRESLTVAKMSQLVENAVQVSDTELKGHFLSQSEEVNLDFIRISEFSLMKDVTVTDDEVARYVSEKATDIQAQYDKDFERKYNLPKKVRARHILLKTEENTTPEMDASLKTRMDEILLQARANPTADGFGALALRWSEDPSNAVKGGDLGFFDEKRMDPAFSAAAFALKPGEISDVVKSKFGYHIILAEEFQDAKVIPREEVASDIARELLKKERATAKATELAAQIQAAWAKGEDINPILTANNLTQQETGLFARSQGRIPKLGGDADTLSTAFSLKVDSPVATPVTVPGGKAVFRLKERKEADLATFESKKTEMREDALRTKRSEVMEAWTNGLKANAKIEAFGYQGQS